MSGFWRRSLDQLYHSLTDDANVAGRFTVTVGAVLDLRVADVGPRCWT